jgi:hypothetical protein
MTQMISMNRVDDIWARQESASGKDVVRERIESVPDLNCYVGIIGITGARIFQLELGQDVKVNNYLKKFRGVEIQTIALSNSRTMYTIILLENSLKDVFSMFIEDILGNLSSLGDAQQAISTINQRVNYWRKLFSKVSGETLSIEKQRGLFGELLLLETLLKAGDKHSLVLNSWRGVYSSNQDFAMETKAIEVKTSKAGTPKVIISNEHQLDYSCWEGLFLLVILVNESSGKDNSLSSKIKEIRLLLKDDSLLQDEFQAKLNEIGISPRSEDEYNEISFSVRSLRYYRIVKGFPVIMASSFIDTPISSVKYQIDITACSKFEEHEERVILEYL